MNPVLHSSAKHDWQTPQVIWDLVREVAGVGVDVHDPCPPNPTEDGLALDWDEGGLYYVNPPYGRSLFRWASKCLVAGDAGAQIILLVPARPDTAWFRLCWGNAQAWCLWSGRLTFVGADHPAPFPSALFYWGDRPHRFCDVLHDHGLVGVLR